MAITREELLGIGGEWGQLRPEVLEQVMQAWGTPREPNVNPYAAYFSGTDPRFGGTSIGKAALRRLESYPIVFGGALGYGSTKALPWFEPPPEPVMTQVGWQVPRSGSVEGGLTYGDIDPRRYNIIEGRSEGESAEHEAQQAEMLRQAQDRARQFEPLEKSGFLQVRPKRPGKMSLRINEPGGYRDPSQIYYHPQYGLVTPQSNYIPEKKDWMETVGDVLEGSLPGLVVGALSSGLGLPALLGGGVMGSVGSGAITGGLTSAITGGDPLKGVLGGALGGGLGAAIPAGSFVPQGSGPVGEFLGAAARRAAIGGIRTGIMGGDPVQGALSGALGPLAGVARATGLLGQQPQAQARPIPRQMQAEPVSRGPLGTIDTGGGLPAQASQPARYAAPGRLPRGLSMGAGPGLRGLS